MATILSGLDGGTDTVAVTTGNSGGASGTAFDAVNGAPTYTTTTVAHNNLAINTSLSAIATRDVRWSTTYTGLGGSTSAFWIRDYARIGAAPTVVARLFQTLAAGTARWGVAVDTTGHIGVRNLSSGAFATTGLSTLTLTANSWFRYEAQANWNGADWTVILRVFVGSNVDGFVPDETLTTTGGLTLGSVDTFAWGGLSSAATTWANVFHDSIGLTDVTWLGPDLPVAPLLNRPARRPTFARVLQPAARVMQPPPEQPRPPAGAAPHRVRIPSRRSRSFCPPWTVTVQPANPAIVLPPGRRAQRVVVALRHGHAFTPPPAVLPPPPSRRARRAAPPQRRPRPQPPVQMQAQPPSARRKRVPAPRAPRHGAFAPPWTAAAVLPNPSIVLQAERVRRAPAHRRRGRSFGLIAAASTPVVLGPDVVLLLGPPESKWSAGLPALRWAAADALAKWSAGQPEV